MRSAPLVLGLVLGLIACDKKDTPTAAAPDAAPVPTADVEEAVGDEAPSTDEGDDEAEPADAGGEVAADNAGPGPVATTEGTDAGAAPSEGAGGTAEPPEGGGEADKPAGPAPLPKARYTKVDNSCGKDPGVGQKLKSFSLKNVDGKKVTNRSFGNRVLLVNFWGTWCKPCLKELPEFSRLYRKYRKHGLTLVAIATDDDPEPVKAILSKSKISAKVAIGGEDYAGKYGSPKFPFSFVVDPKGNIKASFRGFEPKCMGKLEAEIRSELEKRNAG